MAESLLTSSRPFPVSEQRVDSASFPLSSNIKSQVQRFWQKSPCDSWFTNEPRGTVAFYRSIDEHSYKVHPLLQSAIGFEKTRGLRVLEIGCGCGSEAERFVRAGAYYTAVDLTNAALSITRRRFQLANLEGRSVQGDAENLPFPDSSFDFVYSHGVLHHTSDTPRAIREVHRVLSPGGRAPRGDQLRLFVTGLGIASLLLMWVFISAKYNIPMPSREVLWGVLAALFVAYMLLRFILGSKRADELTSKVLERLARIYQRVSGTV